MKFVIFRLVVFFVSIYLVCESCSYLLGAIDFLGHHCRNACAIQLPRVVRVSPTSRCFATLHIHDNFRLSPFVIAFERAGIKGTYRVNSKPFPAQRFFVQFYLPSSMPLSLAAHFRLPILIYSRHLESCMVSQCKIRRPSSSRPAQRVAYHGWRFLPLLVFCFGLLRFFILM